MQPYPCTTLALRSSTRRTAGSTSAATRSSWREGLLARPQLPQLCQRGAREQHASYQPATTSPSVINYEATAFSRARCVPGVCGRKKRGCPLSADTARSQPPFCTFSVFGCVRLHFFTPMAHHACHIHSRYDRPFLVVGHIIARRSSSYGSPRSPRRSREPREIPPHILHLPRSPTLLGTVRRASASLFPHLHPACASLTLGSRRHIRNRLNTSSLINCHVTCSTSLAPRHLPRALSTGTCFRTPSSLCCMSSLRPCACACCPWPSEFSSRGPAAAAAAALE